MRKAQAHGFTLIELAIVMVIVGLIIAAALPSLKTYRNTADIYETREKMTVVQEAMREFFGRFGRYPCPARPDLPPDDPNFGLEQCRPDTSAACPFGIVCTNTGSRNADGTGGNDPVTIGALPIKTLVYPQWPDTSVTLFSPIEESHGYDAWFGRYTYAVSEEMTWPPPTLTPSTPANVQLGAIFVEDEMGQDIVDPPGSAHYVFVSHGANARGAFSIEGVNAGNCDINAIMGSAQPEDLDIVGTPGLEIELENCDRDDAKFISALYSENRDNDSYFDDQIFFNATTASALWRQSNFSPATETFIYNTNFGNVGVGLDAPASKLDINGSIRVETTIAASEGYCDPTQDTKCLNPSLIGGIPPAGSSCVGTNGPGYVARGIENNQLVCINLFPSGPIGFNCPDPTHFVRGFSNLGNIICDPG